MAQVSESDAESPTVLVDADSGVGHLRLNRPRAINALDLTMVRLLSEALARWEDDTEITLVVITGEGERGLCAGGDVRGLHAQIVQGQAADTATFFRAEYALNLQIAQYPKPIIAIADGVTMGGGIGVAGHASLRVVTERSALAMPETRIGFTPDVGGSALLARAPGRLGEYLALTGEAMDAADALYAGFADVLIPSENIDDFLHALRTRADPQTPAEIAMLFDATAGPARLEAARPWIDDAFSQGDVAGILARLDARPEPDAAVTAATLRTLSPVALTVTLAAVRRARDLASLADVLAQEYGLVLWFAHTQPDLVEGIRAQLVDKTRDPRWTPATLAEVAPDLAEDALAFVPSPALWS